MYTLDRSLGSRELGMALVHCTAGRVAEHEADSTLISTYYERDYVHGIATDKIPVTLYRHEIFLLELAKRLGTAAAPNLIVGRCSEEGETYFDDGDEIVPSALLDKPDGPFPACEIQVTDNTGSFRDFTTSLEKLLAPYDTVFSRRAPYVRNYVSAKRAAELIGEACELFTRSLRERFAQIRNEFLEREAAYRQLFRHRRQNPGSFGYRWQKVLDRLAATEPSRLKLPAAPQDG
jgi:hypothetical protein